MAASTGDEAKHGNKISTGRTDFWAFAQQQNFQIKTPEDPDEADHRRHRERLILYLSVGFVGIAALIAFGFFIFGEENTQKFQFSYEALKVIGAGLLGFLVGKSQSS